MHLNMEEPDRISYSCRCKAVITGKKLQLNPPDRNWSNENEASVFSASVITSSKLCILLSINIIRDRDFGTNDSYWFWFHFHHFSLGTRGLACLGTIFDN